MGGLFSSKKNEAKWNNAYSTYPYHDYNTITGQQNSMTYGYGSRVHNTERPCRPTYQSRRILPTTYPSNSFSVPATTPRSTRYDWQENTSVTPKIIPKYDPSYFPKFENVHSLYFSHNVYTLTTIETNDPEYRAIRRRITNRFILVQSIEKINNPRLEMSYELKKLQKLESNPDLDEIEFFHGTKLCNADKICKDNFNWRYHGTGTGHRFGQGVSFSCNAMYAANYSSDQGDKVMFIARVLIGKCCLGSKFMKLPDKGYDTSTKQNDHIVVVKYEDNEFFPVYKITYNISPDYVPMNNRKGGRRR